jgi:hypothetical protein
VILILGGLIEIRTSHTYWELMGCIDSKQPLILDYNGGHIIAQVNKLEYATGNSRLHVEILPQYGELVSCFGAGALIFEIT